MKEIYFFLLAHSFMIYCIFRAFDGYFDRSQVNWRLELVAYGLFYLLNSFMFLVVRTPMLNALTCVTAMFLITFLYPGTVKRRFLVSLGIYLGFLTMEILVSLLLGGLGWDPVSSPGYGMLIPVMGLFTLVLVLNRLHRSRESQPMELWNWIAIFLIPAGSIFLMVLTLGGQSSQDMIFATSMVLAGMNILVFYLFDKLEQHYQIMGAKQLLEQQNLAYANELALIRQNEQRLTILRHDLKNHLTVIRHFAGAGEMQELDEYLDTFTEKMTQQKEYVHSGNLELDCILNYKLEEASRAGAQLEISVVLPDNLGMDCFDINVMLGNLLDNAIAGLASTREKRLMVDIRMEMGILCLRVENSYDGVVKKAGSRYLSRKADAGVHGIGLAAVEQTVKKYDGQMQVESAGDMFRVQLLLYPPEPESDSQL